jgi:hypothetical protein
MWNGQRVHQDVWEDPVQDRRQVRLDNRGQGDRLDMGRVRRGHGLSAVGDLLLLSIFRCGHWSFTAAQLNPVVQGPS